MTGIAGAITILAPFQGGTGQDTSNWTGVIRTDSGAWSTTTAGGGSQTPWASNIDGAGYNLTNVGNLEVDGTALTLGVDGVNANRTQTIWAENGYEANLKFMETSTYGMGIRYNATNNILYWDRYMNSATPSGSNMAYRSDGTTIFEGNTLVVDVPDDRVGVGTTDPQRPLHMLGDGTSETGWARFGLSATEYTEIGHRGNNSAINAVGDGNLDFRHDGTTRASLTDAGVLTATTFSGALTGNCSGSSGSCTGNALTATSLAGNGANCGAGQAPLGVNASGAVESCFDVWTEAENTAAGYYSTADDNYLLNTGDTASGNYNFDSNTLFIDSASNEIGIGTATPAARLHVNYPSAGSVIFQAQAEGGGDDLDIKFGHNGYGWYWRYLGSGSGDGNALQLWSEGAGGADDQVYDILQSGNITFKQMFGLNTGTTVNDIDTTVANSDNALITSGGVFDGLAGKQATLGNNDITPDMVLSTGQIDEYVLTYEVSGDTWEWQSVAGGGDITDVFNCSTGDCSAIVMAAGDSLNCSSGDINLNNDSVDAADINTINCGTNCTWDATNDEIDIDDAFLKNNANDIMVGTLTADGLTLGANENITLGASTLDHDGTDFVFNDTVTITGDSGGADDASVPMTLYNTDATPPAASGFPIGTIYLQYTP